MQKRILDPVLGPGVGKRLDGDARQRKLMLLQLCDHTSGKRYKPISADEGFLFSAAHLEDRGSESVINNLSDQDYIHNHKS